MATKAGKGIPMRERPDGRYACLYREKVNLSSRNGPDAVGQGSGKYSGLYKAFRFIGLNVW